MLLFATITKYLETKRSYMSLLSLEPPVYQVGDILYSPTSGAIEKQGEISRLRAREANLFHALIESFPEVLSRKEIEEQLWKDSYATNATINQTIKALRFSLNDEQRTLIRTIPKQGYVLATKPQVVEEELSVQAPLSEANENALTSDSKAQDQSTNLNTKKESSVTLLSLFSINQWVLVLACGVIAFAISASGVFMNPPERTSFLYKGHWILFVPEEGELERLNLEQLSTPHYVLKTNNEYRVCKKTEGTIQCQLAD
jgi:DNA-binding winged helix-turn-helix (wHTH) protein